MIVLHQFKSAFGVPNSSPFCMKLECFLRMSGLAYRSETLHDPSAAPKGKGPFIELDGVALGDSTLIIQALEARFGIDLERGLSPAERAVAHAMGVMLEERTYFVMLHERWVEEDGWPLARDTFLADLPPPVQDQIRARQAERVDAQGLGGHSRAERRAFVTADVAALADWLGNKPFFMGPEPTKIDATVHAFVCNLLAPQSAAALAAIARRHANLVAYDARMLARYFPEHRPAAA